MIEITYLTEPIHQYAAAVRAAKSQAELKTAIAPYEAIAWDAFDVAHAMSGQDFERFQKCAALERAGQYSGDENQDIMGPLLMPETMFKVAIIAAQYCVPWGCAFIRLREVGRITEKAGRYIVSLNEEAAA